MSVLHGAGAYRQTTVGTEAHDLAVIPKLAERGGQRMADDRCYVRRADEPAGLGGSVRRCYAEALVGQRDDAHVRGVLRDAHRMVPMGVQDGLRRIDRLFGRWLFRGAFVL